MKRWQSKKEKLTIGGLFLLLLAGSLPWVGYNESEFGSANLSAMSRPEGFKPEDASLVPANPPAKPGANPKNQTPPPRPRQVERSSEETDENSIQRQFEINNKTLTATYEQSEEDPSKTVVTLETEAQGPCPECDVYTVSHRLNGGNLDDIKKINLAIKASIKESQKAERPRIGQRGSPRKTQETRRDDDPIAEKCDSIRSRDNFTLCAMKELGRIANITGDDAYDADELEALFEKHIFRNLEEQLRDRRSAGRRDEAKTATTNLIEKLDRSNGDGLRSILTRMKTLPLRAEAERIATLDRELKMVEKTNPSRALQLRNELNLYRMSFNRTLGEDLYDTSLAYESLVDDDRFSRSRLLSEFTRDYVDPLNSYRDAVWSNDPFDSLNRIQSQNLSFQANGFSTRNARAQGGTSMFPPLDQNGQNWQNGGNNAQTRGFNTRSFPQTGSTLPNRNFQQSNNNFQQPWQPAGGFGANTGFNGMGSRFSAPTTNYNYNTFNPGFSGTQTFGNFRQGTPYNTMPYNGLSAYNGNCGVNSFSPGFANGWNGSRLGTPTLNGANYFSGFNGCGSTVYPLGSGLYQGLNRPISPIGGGAWAPNMYLGTQGGMSAARPRF